jgi:hypothetical protein
MAGWLYEEAKLSEGSGAGGAREASFRFCKWRKIFRMTLGSVMKAMTRSSPPQFRPRKETDEERVNER